MFIRNVIFDMGGVIIDIDFKRTAEAFARLGAVNFYDLYNQKGQAPFIDQFEKGEISAAQFRLELKNNLGLAETVTDQQIDEAWNALFIDLPRERLDLIRGMREQGKYNKVLLFSNTNEIHHRKFSTLCPPEYGPSPRDPVFADCFDKEYYSFRLGQKKPSPEAFIAILKEQKLNAEETVFIDDSIQNINGAMKAGLHTIHWDVTKGCSMRDVPKLIAYLNQSLEVMSGLDEVHLSANESKADEGRVPLLRPGWEAPLSQTMISDVSLSVPVSTTMASKNETKKALCCSCLFSSKDKPRNVKGEETYLLRAHHK